MSLRQFWTALQFQATTGGQWGGRHVPPADVRLTGVGIDSRTVGIGQAFIAIKGERFDGHDFLIEAVSNGAALLLVEQCDWGTVEAIERESSALNGGAGVPILMVDSTIAALARLAAAYRQRLAPHTTVIGITGTNGKTTTRRIAQTVLSRFMQGTASVRSFNNHIGVPLTILAARADDRFLVAEVGTNAPGEIAYLGAILRPDIAVITSIGAGHLEGLGTLHEVAVEKAALLRFMQAGERSLAVVNADAEIDPALLDVDHRLFTFGWSARAMIRMTDCSESINGTRFHLADGSDWQCPLLGRHNAGNATAAIVVARHLGLSDEAIQAGLSGVTPEHMRLEPLELQDGTLVINDAYNANPDSMQAALGCLVRVRADRPAVVVLGDMLELGPGSSDYHRTIVRQAVQYLRDGSLLRAVLIGPSMLDAAQCEHAAADDRVIVSASNDPQTMETLAGRAVEPGDVVLVKASRGMALERFIDALQRQCADRKKRGSACS